MSAKILDIIDDYRKRFTSYRDNMAEHLAIVISDASKIADKPKLEHVSEDGPLVKQPRLGYDQVSAMLHEIQKTNTYLDRLHEIEKSLLSKTSARAETDYLTLRGIEDFLGITKQKKMKH